MLESTTLRFIDVAIFIGAALAVGWLCVAFWRLLKMTWELFIMLWYGLINKVAACLTTLLKPFAAIGTIWFFALRGRLTVRASTYLMALSQPNATPELCNRLALSIDTYAAKQLLPETRYHLNSVFNGNSLALISEARLQGFIG